MEIYLLLGKTARGEVRELMAFKERPDDLIGDISKSYRDSDIVMWSAIPIWVRG